MPASDFVFWSPRLWPGKINVDIVPFTRGSGPSLGGIERAERTDRGYWRVTLADIALRSPEHRRTWNAIRTAAGGRSGLIVVPIYSGDSAPGEISSETVPFSDGSEFSDGTGYVTRAVDVSMEAPAALGATVVTIRLNHADIDDLVGTRFSFQHAFYEIGAAIEIDGALWTVPVFPAIRRAIPAGADLEFDRPDCLVHLAADRAMDLELTAGDFDLRSVSFVEAVDYWSDLAIEEA